MQVALAFSITALAILAGCTGSEPPRSNSTSTGTSGTPGPTLGPVPDLGVNLTDCSGSSMVVTVPVESLRDDVPENYSLVTLAPRLAALRLDFLNCGKIAHAGLDGGRGSIHALLVRVVPAKTDFAGIAWFVLALATNHSGVDAWWTETTAKSPAHLEFHQTEQSYGDELTLVEGKATDGVSAVYEFDFIEYGRPVDKSDNWLLYYGQDPEQDFVECEIVSSHLGVDGVGTLRSQTNSNVALVVGPGPHQTFASFIVDQRRLCA
jgi:hypothetical protein